MHGKKNNILLKWIRRKIDQFLPKKRILSWDNSCTRATTTEKQQNCSHKTWYMHIEIVCIGINKKSFVSVLRKNKLCHVLLSWFSGVDGKNCIEKTKKVSSFQNHDTLRIRVLGRIFPLVGGIFLLVGWIFFSLVKNFFCPFLQCVFAKGQNFVSVE